jgi:two-component system response regulator VicR
MTHKVVVIEDEPQVVELLRLILRHAEIEVFTALDGKAGLELIRQTKPDLVMLDIMMPAMNGWDVYDAMRSDAELKFIPVIIESVLPERFDRKVAFTESPIDFYFTKPFDTTRLRREVGRMLGNEEMWPPPKPRTPRPLSLAAASDFLSMAQPPTEPPPAPAPTPHAPADKTLPTPTPQVPPQVPVEKKPDQSAPNSPSAL